MDSIIAFLRPCQSTTQKGQVMTDKLDSMINEYNTYSDVWTCHVLNEWNNSLQETSLGDISSEAGQNLTISFELYATPHCIVYFSCQN